MAGAAAQQKISGAVGGKTESTTKGLFRRK
jgi:hypothetical protein